MSSAASNDTIKSTSNNLLTHNTSDLAQTDAQKALNSLQDNKADLDLSHEIPMNLLPAGN